MTDKIAAVRGGAIGAGPDRSLARFSMVTVERHAQYRGRDNVENDDVDVRLPLDQSKHRYPLPGMVRLLLPLGRALIPRNLVVKPVSR